MFAFSGDRHLWPVFKIEPWMHHLQCVRSILCLIIAIGVGSVPHIRVSNNGTLTVDPPSGTNDRSGEEFPLDQATRPIVREPQWIIFIIKKAIRLVDVHTPNLGISCVRQFWWFSSSSHRPWHNQWEMEIGRFDQPRISFLMMKIIHRGSWSIRLAAWSSGIVMPGQ